MQGDRREHRGAVPEKAILSIALIGLFIGGYYAIGLHQDPTKAHTLATRLDRALLFKPAWMFAYGGVYTALLLPLFVVENGDLFRRVVVSYFAVLVVSFARDNLRSGMDHSTESG